MGSSGSVTTGGKFYPNWSGDNEGCLVDNSTSPAPEYMHLYQAWFTDALEECCDRYYSYSKAGCMGDSAVGSEKYFVDWGIHSSVWCEGLPCGLWR